MTTPYHSLIAIVALSAMVAAPLAEARRVGGGNSAGMSRNTAPAPQRQAQPQQQQSAQNTSSQQPAAQPPAQRSGDVGMGTVAGAAVAAGAVGYMMGNANEAQAADTEPMTAVSENPIASEPLATEQPRSEMNWLLVAILALGGFFLFRRFTAKKP